MRTGPAPSGPISLAAPARPGREALVLDLELIELEVPSYRARRTWWHAGRLHCRRAGHNAVCVFMTLLRSKGKQLNHPQ
ncbi:MAG: hypothetical protein ACLQBX_01270, partial [Candidatus Limnocylindrales bacterium]